MKLSNKQRKIIKNSKNAKFYSIVDELNLPRVTVCIIKKKKYFSRGISICSMDTALPDPQEGYFRSWKNAMRAMNRGIDSYPIMRLEAFNVINSLKSTLWADNWGSRSMFDILPNNGIEKKFFKCMENEAS
jgi:hypothetical protein